MLVFLFLVNSIDYVRTYQCGLIGELVGGGKSMRICIDRIEYSTDLLYQ
jgi:hypothetical protein